MRNEKGNILTIVLASFLLLAIGAASYFFWQNQLLQQKYNTQHIPSNNPTPFPTQLPQVNTPQPATNLIKFSDPAGNFTFSYPNNWDYMQASEGCGPVWYAPNSKNIWLTICGFTFSEKSIDDMANRLVSPGDQLIEKSEISVAGHKAIRQKVKTGNQTVTSILVSDVVGEVTIARPDGKPEITEQKIGIIPISFYSLGSATPSEVSDATKAFDQMLNTFHFPRVP